MAIQSTGRLLWTSIALAFSLAASANDDAFDRGNAAFRTGDFNGALASYSDAMAGGRQDARLFYNMGLAHRRLEQNAQARLAFLESAKDDGMAAPSFYQLGVLANAEGNAKEAESWFKKARSQATGTRLKDLSTDALVAIGAPASTFNASLTAGFGYDGNAFRAPNDSYTDFSRDPAVPVEPVEQSGLYVPVRALVAFSSPVSSRSRVVASYRHRGDYYTDSGLDNADETDHRLTVGLEHDLGSRRSEYQMLEVAAVFRSHGETNFDRDDGLDRFDDGESIADRFDYNAVGAEFDLRNRFGRYRYEIDAGFTQRDYEDVPTASSYDLSAYWAEIAFKVPLASTSRLELGAGYHVRSFDERRARDALGDSSSQNPTLEYQYQFLEVALRQRVSESIVAELSYTYMKREDEFVGYNDYDRDKIALETRFDLTDRLSASLEIDYRDQQYPRAFAFNDPSQAAKEYQDLQLSAGVLYRLSERLAFRADVRSDDVDSSDPRGEYDRVRTRIGVSMEF